MSGRGQPRRVSTVGTGRMVRVRRWPRAGRCAARPSRRGGLWVIESLITTNSQRGEWRIFGEFLSPETRWVPCGRALQYHSREETCRRPSPPSRSRHGARRAERRAERRVRATRRPRAYRPGTPTFRRDPSARGRPCHALVFRGHPPRAPRAAAALPSPRARARGFGTMPSGSGRSTACLRSSRARRGRGTPGTGPRPRSRVPGT